MLCGHMYTHPEAKGVAGRVLGNASRGHQKWSVLCEKLTIYVIKYEKIGKNHVIFSYNRLNLQLTIFAESFYNPVSFIKSI